MATTKKSPLQAMKDKFGDKETLVDRVLSVIHLVEGEDKDALKSRLLAVSNRKLLRMFEVASEMKSKYGSPEGLAEAAAKAAGKAKDSAYVAKLTKLAQKSPARVLDVLKAAAGKAA
jgi:hypothetical protein